MPQCGGRQPRGLLDPQQVSQSCQTDEEHKLLTAGVQDSLGSARESFRKAEVAVRHAADRSKRIEVVDWQRAEQLVGSEAPIDCPSRDLPAASVKVSASPDLA
jgi:hypothetical protein